MVQSLMLSLHHTRTYRKLVSIGFSIGLGIVVSTSSATIPVAFGQEPAFIVLKPSGDFTTAKAVKEFQTKKKEMLKGNADYDSAEVKAYYRNFVLPRLTMVDQINAARQEIFTDLGEIYKDGRKPETRKDFVTLVANVCKEGIKKEKNYNPATRVNCLLILGQLDASPGVKSSKLPVPLADVRDILLAEVAKPDNEAMVGAALVGLERHSRVSSHNWDDVTKTKVATAMNQLLTTPAPLSRNAEVNSYYHRKALEILSYFDSPEHAKTKEYILEVVSNREADTFLRAVCIRSLGKQDVLSGQAAEKIAATETGIVQFVRYELMNWSDGINKKSPADAASGGYGGMMGGGGRPGVGGAGAGGGSAGMDGDTGGAGGYPGGGAPPKREDPDDIQPPEVRLARRYLNTILDFAHVGENGLPGVKPKTNGPETNMGVLFAIQDAELKGKTESFLKLVEAVQKALNSDEIKDMDTLRKKMKKSVDKLLKETKSFPGLKDPTKEDSVETEETSTEGAAEDSESSDESAAEDGEESQ